MKDTVTYIVIGVVVLAIVLYVFKQPMPTGAEMAGGKMPTNPQPKTSTPQQPQPKPSTGLTAASQLNVGSTGPVVKELQQVLTSKGFDTKGADGIYGPKTLAAHNAFLQNAGSTDRSLNFAKTGGSVLDWGFNQTPQNTPQPQAQPYTGGTNQFSIFGQFFDDMVGESSLPFPLSLLTQ